MADDQIQTEADGDNDELSLDDHELLILVMRKLQLAKMTITDEDIAECTAAYGQDAPPTLLVIEDDAGVHITLLSPEEAAVQAECDQGVIH